MPADQTWLGFITTAVIMETHWVQIQSDFRRRKTIAGSRRGYLCPVCSIVVRTRGWFLIWCAAVAHDYRKMCLIAIGGTCHDRAPVAGRTNLTRFRSQNILLLIYIILYTYIFLRVRRAILKYTRTAKTFLFIFIFVPSRFFPRCFFLVSVNAVNAWYSHGGGKNK
jgi:hypothetical protein